MKQVLTVYKVTGDYSFRLYSWASRRKGGCAWIESGLWSRHSPNFWTSQSYFLSHQASFPEQASIYWWPRLVITQCDAPSAWLLGPGWKLFPSNKQHMHNDLTWRMDAESFLSTPNRASERKVLLVELNKGTEAKLEPKGLRLKNCPSCWRSLKSRVRAEVLSLERPYAPLYKINAVLLCWRYHYEVLSNELLKRVAWFLKVKYYFVFVCGKGPTEWIGVLEEVSACQTIF